MAALVGVAAGAVALAGCSGSGPADDEDNPATTPAGSEPTTLEDGTTAPGTELELGSTATVGYTADRRHDSLIELSVTSVQRGKVKDLEEFDLTGAARKSNVYYVQARVKNIGGGDLSGEPLTLYGQVSADLVVPPVEFGSTFERCDSDPLPNDVKESKESQRAKEAKGPKEAKNAKKAKHAKKAKKAKKARVCLVILAPDNGKISAVQWRPPGNAAPISWLPRSR